MSNYVIMNHEVVDYNILIFCFGCSIIMNFEPHKLQGCVVMKYQHPEAVYGCDWSPHNAYATTDLSTSYVHRTFVLYFQGFESLCGLQVGRPPCKTALATSEDFSWRL